MLSICVMDVHLTGLRRNMSVNGKSLGTSGVDGLLSRNS